MARRAPPRLALALAAAALGCGGSGAHESPFRAAEPAQVLEGAGNEAQAEMGGVAVRAAVGGWRGTPRHLEQRLTPVDVTIRNGSARPVRIGPEAFELVVGETHLRVLDRRQVIRALSDLGGERNRIRPPRSAVGAPTFPGYDPPGRDPPSDTPSNAPLPAAGSRYQPQFPSGTLAPGQSTSMMLYFDMPARTLRSATFEVDLVAADGQRIGTVRLPYVHEYE